MRFVHPEILWALTALAVPVLIHLFNFRRYKKIAFSNVSFLKEVKSETTKSSKIRHLIILICRLLAFAALILAFAQPFFPTALSEKMNGSRAVSVYIDNSLSMQGQQDGVSFLETSKQKASALVSSFSNNDRFQIISNNFKGSDQRLLSKDEALQSIQDISFSPETKQISSVFDRQRDLLEKSAADIHLYYWISDFQRNTFDIQDITNVQNENVTAIPATLQKQKNISIDSICFSTPQRILNNSDTLLVVIQNHSSEEISNVPLSVELDGIQKAVSAVSLPGNGIATVPVAFSTTQTGFHYGSVRINDFPLVFDDVHYFAYTISEKINILNIIGSEQQSIAQLFSEDPQYNFNTVNASSVSTEAIQSSNFIVVQGVQSLSPQLIGDLSSYIEQGGTAFLVPHSVSDLLSYNNLLGRCNSVQLGAKSNTALSAITVDLNNSFYSPAFERLQNNASLPSASLHFPLNNGNLQSIPLISFQDNTPLLAQTNFGKGRLFVCAVSALKTESTFLSHALFPVSLLRAAETSAAAQQLYYQLGKESFITLSHTPTTAEGLFEISSTNNSRSFIAQSRNVGGQTEVFLPTEINESGFYALKENSVNLMPLAMNFNNAESSVDLISGGELMKLAQQIGLTEFSIKDANAEMLQSLATELGGGISLWKYLIYAALFFLALEIVFIKLWKSKI
ncbi:MAG: hypothetical protein RLZZ71_2054 [Bacteroidota bacterium]|jgi:hypothetical protein